MSKQAVKQIVQVLVHAQKPRDDEVILRPGRKKKTKKTAKKKPTKKAPSAPKPSGPEGFISQVFGPPRPPPGVPAPFISAQFSNLSERIRQAEQDSQLAKALQRIEKLEAKETPTPERTTTLTRVDTTVLEPARPATGMSIGLPSEVVRQVSIPQRTVSQPSVSLRQLTGQEIASGIMQRARSQVLGQPQSAPNRANQPSVDVDGDGKEEKYLQPQQPSFRLARSSSGVSPYQLAAQPAVSSSSVFGETPDQEFTPEFAAAAREARVKLMIEENVPVAGSQIDIVTGVIPPAIKQRKKVIEEDEDDDLPQPPPEIEPKKKTRRQRKGLDPYP
jgi:hypothetical protein